MRNNQQILWKFETFAWLNRDNNVQRAGATTKVRQTLSTGSSGKAACLKINNLIREKTGMNVYYPHISLRCVMNKIIINPIIIIFVFLIGSITAQVLYTLDGYVYLEDQIGTGAPDQAQVKIFNRPSM